MVGKIHSDCITVCANLTILCKVAENILYNDFN